MLEIPGYHVLVKIHETAHSQVYRGQRISDGLPVICKLLRAQYPTPEELTRYKFGFFITRRLELEGVIRVYELLPYQHSLAMMLEDFGGTSLAELSARQLLPQQELLALAIAITATLGALHDRQVIHKDINPSNIVYNPATGQLKLIDFGIASDFAQELPFPKDPAALEGTLAYMSPEQTGQMNRTLDYRTDYYSLGVTLYQLLTGRLPFPLQDPLELLHHHLAVQPEAPHALDARIPPMLSAIVLRLMAKAAEDRYQSAVGIIADLEACQQQLARDGRVAPFTLAQHDTSSRFSIPEKLYGRDRELASLLDAFGRVARAGSAAGDPELILVAGPAGIGKSMLVHELYKPITQARGCFITGKFDQYQRNIPYFALTQAFEGLARQLLTESDVGLQRWRELLLEMMGPNGQVLTQLVPALELIVGPQPPVPELPPAEAQHRFNQLFLTLARTFAQPEHPMVLFLDDLQWVDLASIKLIELLALADDLSLLLIGAFRDAEVGATHPLTGAIEAITAAGRRTTRLALTPLRLQDLERMIADTLHHAPAEIAPLAELVQQKTGGNPFFTRAFLRSLATDGLLTFQAQPACWSWSLAEIQARGVTDNVVELMAAQIRRLTRLAQQALSLGACIGNSFELPTLAAVLGVSQPEAARALRPAILAGLIQPLGNGHLSAELEVTFPVEHPPVAYQFAHDRIQQAAYGLLPPAERALAHWSVGQRLLELTPPERLEQRSFDIANQLNAGRPATLDDQARALLLDINLRAARQARASAAFAPARAYIQVAQSVIPAGSWQTQYELTLEVTTAAAELAYLAGDPEQLEALSRSVLHHARTILDTIRVHELRANMLVVQGQPVRGIAHLIAVMEQLGVHFPGEPSPEEVQRALAETQALLAGRSAASLLNLPPMSDPHTLAVMRLLASILSPTHTANPNLFPLVVLTQVTLSIQYGNAEISSFSYALYGLILCGVTLQIAEGAAFCRLALDLLGRQRRAPMRARTLLTVHAGAQYWTEHLRATLQPLREGYQAALEDGDPEFAALTALHRCDHAFFAGLPLPEVAAMLEAYHADLLRLRQGRNADALALFQQAVHALTHPGADPTALVGTYYDARAQVPALQAANDRQVLFLLALNQLILGVIFRCAEPALAAADTAATFVDGVTGQASVAVFRFYDSLARLAAYADAPPEQQAQLLEQVASNQELMARWAAHAPMNYQHKWQLVAAELHRVRGEPLEAMEAYDQAAALAQEQGFVQEAALANERAAAFYATLGRHTISQTYLREARYAYLRWGAVAKVQAFDQLHATLRASETTPSLRRVDTTAGDNRLLTELDLTTVLKASQAIASEIVLDSLLERLMAILVEHVGAQTGYLVLQASGAWELAARHTVVGGEGTSTLELAQHAEGLPLSLINYVARTGDIVVLGNAAETGAFTADPWIATRQSKSLLCAPLLFQGTLVGVVLLENNLARDVFTPTRTAILSLLATQAAISLSHARLLRKQTEINRELQDEIAAHTRSRRDRDRLATMLEASPDYVGMSEPSGRVIWNNAPLRGLIGISPAAELSNIEIPHYHPPWAWELIQREGIPTALRAGTWLGETAILGPAGREIPVSQLILAHRDADGQVEYISTIIRDISAQKAAEAEIRLLNAELEERVARRTAELEAANRELEGFSYSVSHDLRAPLRAIDGFSQLFQEDYGGQFEPEAQRYLALVRQNVQRMGALIDDLLAFSRTGRQELRRQPVATAQLVQGVLQELEPDVAVRHIEWLVSDLPDCQGDPSLLRQVWVNLLSNAVKYTRTCPVARIEVRYERVEDEGVYSVRDNGAGFDMRYADKLFGVFQRLHRPQEFEGTGIGLAIVQRIVQRHGGRIWADAAVNQGATFFFTLPEATPDG